MAKTTACKEDIGILMLLWPECVGDVLVIKKPIHAGKFISTASTVDVHLHNMVFMTNYYSTIYGTI